MMVLIAIAAGLTLVAGGFYVWLRVQWAKDDHEADATRFVAPRKYGWEMAYTHAEADALMAARERLDERDRTTFVSHEHGLLVVLDEQPLLVGLTGFAPRWKTALADRDVPNLGAILDELKQTKASYVLAPQSPWFVDERGEELDEIDELDDEEWSTQLARLATLDHGVHSWYVDDELGYLAISVLPQASPSLAGLDRGDKPFYERRTHEQNVLVLDLAAIFARYRRESKAASVSQRMRTALLYFVAESAVGAIWTRPPTSDERLAVTAAVSAPIEGDDLDVHERFA